MGTLDYTLSVLSICLSQYRGVEWRYMGGAGDTSSAWHKDFWSLSGLVAMVSNWSMEWGLKAMGNAVLTSHPHTLKKKKSVLHP